MNPALLALTTLALASKLDDDTMGHPSPERQDAVMGLYDDAKANALEWWDLRTINGIALFPNEFLANPQQWLKSCNA